MDNLENPSHLLHPEHSNGPIDIMITYSLLDTEAILSNSSSFAAQQVTGKFVCVREDITFDSIEQSESTSYRNLSSPNNNVFSSDQ